MFKGMKESGVEKRLRKEMESLYGNEALTSEMDDDSANVFLKWASKRVESIVHSTAEMDDVQAEEVIYPRMRALRKMSRYVNRLVRGADDPEGLLEKFLEQAREVYGESFKEPDMDKLQALLHLPQGEPSVLVQALQHIIEGEEDGEEDNNNNII